MTDTQADTHVNGTAPPASAAEPCDDCATSGEKILAVLAFAFAVFLGVMAIDMFTGGKVTGMVREAAQ
jgi:hypothetical protein